MHQQGPVWLATFVLAGTIATVAGILIGVQRGLKAAGWQDRERSAAVRSIAAVLIVWFFAALVLASRGFYQSRIGPVPMVPIGILIPLLAGAVLFRRWRLLRQVVEDLPVRWMASVQLFRVEGVVFLILLAGRWLPGIFAWPAGVGDVLVGIFAPIVARAYARNPQAMKGRLRTWNLLGLLDLTVALTTGFLSSPSPLQRFAFDRPNVLIAAFPLVLIPVFLVPIAVLLHVVSLGRLRAADAMHASSPRIAREV